MSAGDQTRVFVPPMFETLQSTGLLVKSHKLIGESFEPDDVLFDVRSGSVEGEIVAPFAGTVTRLHASAGSVITVGALLADLRPGPPPPRPMVLRLHDAVVVRPAPALAVVTMAAGALLLPAVWLIVSVLLGAGVAAARMAKLRPAELRQGAPAAVRRWLGGVVACLLLVPTARTARAFAFVLVGLVVAGALAGAVGAAVWALSEAEEGLLAAFRLAVYGHGPQLFSFLMCGVLARRFLAGGSHRERLRQRARVTHPQAALIPTAVAVAAVAWIVAAVALMPTPASRPVGAVTGFVGLFGDGAEQFAWEQRARFVEAGAAATATCATENGRGSWSSPTANARADGSVVVSVRAGYGQSVGNRSAATLLIALANQLGPQGATIVLHRGTGRAPLRLKTSQRSQPVTSLAGLGLAADTASGPVYLSLGEPTPTDLAVALTCSASSV